MYPLGIDDMHAMHEYHREHALGAKRPRQRTARARLLLMSLLRSAFASPMHR